MKSATRRYIWEVAWSNPHKPRPAGVPEIILRMEQLAEGGSGARCPAEIDECWQEMRPYGYAVRVVYDAPPARRLPLESKQRIRRRNVWKRMLKKYPMFCSDFYAEKIQSNPEHYGPYTPGEFADVMFARTTMNELKMVKESK